jgi:hypothetical protein
MQFPVSIGPVPDGLMEFPAIQTYDDGEVVRWVGPTDSEHPAPLVNGITVEGHDGGELSLVTDTHADLHALEDEVAALGDSSSTPPDTTTAPDTTTTDDSKDGGETWGYIGAGLGALALILAIAALASSRKKTV